MLGSAASSITEYIPVLRTVARRLCHSSCEVDDLVQDTLERALGSQKLDVMDNPCGWLIVILRNLHADRYRRRLTRGAHVSWHEATVPEPQAPSEPTDEPVWATLTTDDVVDATKQLPPALRDTYMLFDLQGHSYTEVATTLGIPKATVGTRLMRARCRLQRLLRARLPVQRS